MDKEIMEISVENLAQKQYDFLLQHGIKILETVITNIKLGKYDEIERMLSYSPDGDGWGETNYYINFAYTPGVDMDIRDYIKMLDKLDAARGGK